MATEGFLLDTSVVAPAWDAGHPAHSVVRERLKSVPDELIFVSVITLAEVEYGLQVTPMLDVGRQEAVRTAMSSFIPSQILSIDRHSYKDWARIRAALFRQFSPKDHRGRLRLKRVEDLTERTSGRELGIQESDLWIVTNAVQYDLRFVTRDRRGGMNKIVEAANYGDRTEFW